MEYKDYYKIMGLERDADEKTIKLAYRRLARKYHPDISKEANAEETFKEINEAYEVLKDPEKRKVYDQYGRDWELRQKAGASSRHGAWEGMHGDQQAYWDNLGANQQFSHDFFESLFGTASPHRRTHAGGADFHGNVSVTLEEAYHGAVKELQLPSVDPKQASPQVLRVKIPAGVKSGQKIRLTGQGGIGFEGGKRGDLYLTIHVDKHPLFDVVDNDIYITLPITPWEAALGTTVVVPTLAGKVDLKIPSGSQGGQTLRLKKRGLPGATPGDQYVLLKIIIPQPVTDAAKALYEQMAEQMPFNPREKMGV